MVAKCSASDHMLQIQAVPETFKLIVHAKNYMFISAQETFRQGVPDKNKIFSNAQTIQGPQRAHQAYIIAEHDHLTNALYPSEPQASPW